jgi:transcriptional regulator with XRE-family HTH domain
MASSERIDRIGAILAHVREAANMTQAALAKVTRSNNTKIFRIESGEVVPDEQEIDAYLLGLKTPLANECMDYLHTTWASPHRRPPFPHPNWRTLHTVDQTLVRIEALKADPETKAVFVRALDLYAAEIRRCEDFLQRIDHPLVFVGIISAGKTSAICTSAGLTLDESLPFARRMVLEVGGGRITLCEVRVDAGPQYGLLIEPYTDEEIRRYVLDYADFLLSLGNKQPRQKSKSIKSAKGSESIDATDRDSDEDTPWVPEEMARAIRGLAGLTEAGAEALAKTFPNREELSIQILTKMDLLRRRETALWRQGGDQFASDLEWLQKAFRELNNGRRPGFSLPKRIKVIIPRKVFDSGDLNINIVDTKGIDQSSAREDIDMHFDDSHAIVLLCTKFGEAPDVPTMNLIRRAKTLHEESHANGRVVVLVLPRHQDALDMKDEATNDYVLSVAAGYEAKRSHIQRALQPIGVDNLPVKFLNATDAADVTAFRSFVIEQVGLLRQHYVDRVADQVRKIDELVAHKTAEELALALTEVMQHLRVWANSNRDLNEQVQPNEGLVEDIESSHPRTLWASIRREGNWSNFDYYYHLGFATRQTVASTAGDRIRNLKAVIANLAANPDYIEASEFLRQIAEHVDTAVEALKRQAQLAGQTIYRDALRGATTYWADCESVYGSGRSFRRVVGQETSDLFGDAVLTALRQRLNEEINRGWAELIEGLDGFLEAPADK